MNEDFFSCFAWALPKAFKDPIVSCCFEQGDVLYDTPKAYEGTWADALQHLTTTQGRLYTALWKGNLTILDLGTPEPPVPILPRDVLKYLPSAEPAVLQKYAKNLTHPIVFLMPFDETRSLFREKRQKIENRLRQDFSYQLHLATPQELGLSEARDYMPTLEIACFTLDTPERGKVYECLKSALYVPSKERKANIDRFRLETHGCLCPKS